MRATGRSAVILEAAGAAGRGNDITTVLVALRRLHLLNDTIQSLIAAVYPVLKESYALSFTQIGLITLAFQFTASLLQPLVGLYTDRRPLPFSLAIGMGVTLTGLLLLSVADNFHAILTAAALVGVGSAIFHPESSRMARLASGGQHGLAQSLFQVGGNGGSALGPLLAAFVVVPWGQGSLAWFSMAAVAAMLILARVGLWYRAHLAERAAKKVASRVAGVVATGRVRGRHPAVPDLLEVLLPDQPDELLHAVPDRHVRGIRPERSTSVVRLPRGGGSRYILRWAGRGQNRFQGGHLGVDPRRAAVHPRPAPRQPVLDNCAYRPDRSDTRLGVLGDHGVCPRTATEPRGDGGRAVLRVRIRDGRRRGRSPRLARGPDEHRVRVPRVRVPAAHRDADGVLAEPPAPRE